MSINADQTFHFMVEGESFSLDSPDGRVAAKDILALAQEKKINGSEGPIEDLTLKGKEGVYSGDDRVDLSQEDDFSLGVKAKGKVYHFKVNGQELESNSEKLVALDIIKMANAKGVPLPGQIGNLQLEAVGGPPFGNSDWVDLEQFSEFILIANDPTPVAFME